jgi:hypothetical protein
MCGDMDGAGLACDLTAIPDAERQAHMALARRLFQAEAGERQALQGGYAWRFEADLFEAVSRFVHNERRCCPFLHFAIEVPPHGAPIWLRITGGGESAHILEAMLDLPGSRPSSES